jgi:CRISPR-associated endonuclease/helicase Cas3
MDDFDQVQRARLGVLAALHDIGKYNTGFQSKSGSDQTKWVGHVSPLLALFGNNGYAEEKKLCAAIHFPEIEKWGLPEAVFYLLIASISHHGQPVPIKGNSSSAIWQATDLLDPFAGMHLLFQRVQSWFPHAFQPSNLLIPDRIEFQHAFSGLVTFADWIGSDS